MPVRVKASEPDLSEPGPAQEAPETGTDTFQPAPEAGEEPPPEAPSPGPEAPQPAPEPEPEADPALSRPELEGEDNFQPASTLEAGPLLAPMAAGDLTASLVWLGVPANQDQNIVWADPNQSNAVQSMTYTVNLQSSNTSYDTGKLTVRIPLALWEDRNGRPVVPVAYGIPQAPTPGSDNIPFNYTIDTGANELVITNTAPTESAANYSIQVQYNITPWDTIDMSKATLTAVAEGIDKDGNVNTATSETITYTVDTSVKLSAFSKGDPQLLYYWNPNFTGGAPQPADFANYRWVSWRIAMLGRANQPYSVALNDISTPNGQIYALSKDLANPYNTLNPADFTLAADGQTITSNLYDNQAVLGPANATTLRYLRVLVRYPLVAEGEALNNTVTETLIPGDGIDPTQTATASATTTWKDYVFTYTGAQSSTLKYSGDWQSDMKDIPSKLVLLRNGINLNLAWGISSTADMYAGVNYTGSGGAGYSGELTDDFANWRLVDNSNTSANPWVRMTPDDYQYNTVSLSVATYMIDRGSGQAVYYEAGKNGPLIKLWAMVNGSNDWQEVASSYAGELASAKVFSLPAGTYQVKATYENAQDHFKIQMDFSATIKASSPTLRAWLANADNNGKRLRVQNFSYYKIFNQDGSLHTQPPAAYAFTSAQGVNADIQSQDMQRYGALLNRHSAGVSVWDVSAASGGMKLANLPQNDTVKRQVDVQYWLFGQEAYHGITEAELRQLINAGWAPPSRDSAVFYDLLPLGAFYNAQMPLAVYDINGGAVSTEMTVATIENYKGTGRQLVIFTLTAKQAGKNYTATGVIMCPVNTNGIVSLGRVPYQQLGTTGYTVTFGASVPWDNVPYARNGVNLAAYQVPEDKPLLGGGYADSGSVAPMNAVQGSDGQPVFYDLRGNGVTDVLDTQYMSAQVTISVPVAAGSGLTKLMRADDDGPLGGFSTAGKTQVGSGYTYQLRVTAADKSQMKDVVLFDILEKGANVEGHTGETLWGGTFDSITLDYAVHTGIAPVVYYATKTGLSYTGMTDASLLDTTVWSTTMPADKTAITAVAIDLRKAPDGTDYVFESLTGTQILIHMNAPTNLQNEPNAYNQAAYYSTLIPPQGEPTSSTVSGGRTTVGLYEEPVLEKRADPAGGSDADTAAEVAANQTVTYTLSYNAGSVIATNIVVSDTLPSGMRFVPGSITFTPAGQTAPQAVSDSCYDESAGMITWPAYDQTAAASATFSFQVVAAALPGGAEGIDYRLYENQAGASVNGGAAQASNTVTHKQLNRWASITKAAALVEGALPGEPDAATGGTVLAEENGTASEPVITALGQIVEYHLVVTNSGAGQLSGKINVTDAIPAGTAYVAGSAAAAFHGGTGASQATSSIDDFGGRILWALDKMSDGEEARLSFRVSTPATLLQPGGTGTSAELVFANTAQMEDVDKGETESSETTYHIVSETTVSVQKRWVLDGENEAERPAEVQVQLMADSTAQGAPVVLNAANNWSYEWRGLPILSASRQPIRYTTVEVGDPGEFQVSYSDDTYTITNHYSPGYTSRTAVKSWEDGNNADRLRPRSIQVQLYANGEAYGEPATLDAAGRWQHIWNDLPLKDDAGAIQYTMKELSQVAGYKTTYDESLYIITNKRKPTAATTPASDAAGAEGTQLEKAFGPATGDATPLWPYVTTPVFGLLLAVSIFLYRRVQTREKDRRQ